MTDEKEHTLFLREGDIGIFVVDKGVLRMARILKKDLEAKSFIERMKGEMADYFTERINGAYIPFIHPDEKVITIDEAIEGLTNNLKNTLRKINYL